MRVTGEVSGDAFVIKRLDQIPTKLHALLLQKVKKLNLLLQRHIVQDKLSGQVLHRKSGTLARSIQEKVESGPDYVYGIVGSRINERNPLVYAAIHEHGGTIPAHDVVAKSGMLKFQLKNGATLFRKSVHIPDVHMPERSYVRSALHDYEQMIKDELRDALTKAKAV